MFAKIIFSTQIVFFVFSKVEVFFLHSQRSRPLLLARLDWASGFGILPSGQTQECPPRFNAHFQSCFICGSGVRYK